MKPAHTPHHTASHHVASHHAASCRNPAAWGVRALMSLCLLATLALALAGGASLSAQSVNPPPNTSATDAATPAIPGTAAVTAAAKTQQPRTGAGAATAAVADDVVMLSPFVVTTDRDTGFVAASSLAGGRLGGDLKDTPVAYSVLTSEFIEALSLTDLSDMAQWLPNSSEARNSGNSEWSNNDYYLSSRGVTASPPQRDFFPYGFNFDGYNIERLDMGRGPNSILFGNSGYAGTPNAVSKRARTDKQFTNMAVSYGSWENFRATLDHNMPLTRTFALRLNALYLDREGWQTFDFEKRKGLTLAGTWRIHRRTELRFEADVGKKEKAAVGSNFWDYVSAWSGTHTYSAPISASDSAAGIARYTTNFVVYTPTNGDYFLHNYGGWARTNGGNANSTLPAGGQYVVGELANINASPILNRINLPQDLFAVAEANSFFRIPSRDFTMTADAPLYSEKYYNYTVALTQQIGTKFYAEAAVNFTGLKKIGDQITSRGMTRIYIDVNDKLPNYHDNPNFLQPYTESLGYPHIRDGNAVNARLALAYVLDNTRLGSFRISVLGGFSHTEANQDTWVYALKDVADHRSWPSDKPVYFRYYLNTDSERPYNTSDKTWLYYSTGTSAPPRMVDAGLVRTIHDASTYNSRALTGYNYLQFAGDAKFFNKRLNLLAAFRIDDYWTRLRTTVSQYDYPVDWDGKALVLRPNAPADYETLTYQPLDAAGNPSGAIVTAETRPRENGRRDTRYDDVRFQDDYNAPEKTGTVKTYSLGAVYHLTQTISLFGNYAESFVPPITRYDIAGRLIGAQAAQGRDYGLRLTTLRGKLVANFIRYTGFEKNALSSSVSTMRNWIGSIVSARAVDNLTPNAINDRNLPIPPVGINDTITSEASGWEIDITANLTRGWRLMLNGSITDAYQTNTYGSLRKYLAANDATMRLIIQDAGGIFSGDTATFDPAIDPMRAPDGNGAVQAWNNLMAWRASLTDERQRRNRLVTSTANVFTDYTFQSGPLKGLRIGAGINYRGREVIGYRGGDTIQDPDNPSLSIPNPLTGPLDIVYQPAYTTATATLYYNWRVTRKITLNINLRVANLFDYSKPIYYSSLLRPVDGDLSSPARTMTPTDYYWITPRNFTLTATLRF